VSNLSETSSFFRVKVYIVKHDTSRSEGEVVESWSGSTVPDKQLSDRFEFNVESYFVVLKGNKRKSQSSVSAEPELEWDVESVLREYLVRGSSSYVSESSHLGYITDKLSITSLLRSRVSKLIPDVEPSSDVFVDLGSTDFYIYVLKKSVSESSYPCDLRNTGKVTSKNCGYLYSESTISSKITVSVRSNSVSAAWLSRIYSVFDSLSREVGVSSVDNLKESDLCITCKINVLGTICHELH